MHPETASADVGLLPVSEEGGGGFDPQLGYTQLAMQAMSETAGFVKNTVNTFQVPGPLPSSPTSSFFFFFIALEPRLE